MRGMSTRVIGIAGGSGSGKSWLAAHLARGLGSRATLLAQDPDLMLLDEPTSHQDVAQQQIVMRLLREMSSRHAVILSTHDVNLAARFATHVLLLSARGHVAGTIESVLTPGHLEHAFGCRFRITATSTHPVFIVQ